MTAPKPFERYLALEPTLRELFARPRNVVLCTHEDADCDGVGSEIGLARGLATLGHKVHILNSEPLLHECQFLDVDNQVGVLAEGESLPPGTDLLVALDAGASPRLGPLKAAADATPGITTVLADHHINVDPWFQVSLCIPGMSSTGELAFHMLKSLGAKMDPVAAHSLYAALAEDSGFFCYDRTQPETFTAASELVRLGADPYKVFMALRWGKAAEQVRAFGRGLASFQTAHGGRTIYLVYEEEEIPEEVKHLLVDTLLSVAGVEVSLIFTKPAKHNGDVVKVSLRGRDAVNVQAIAARFGGGGHRLSSGIKIKETPMFHAVNQVLAACEDAYRALGWL